MTSQHAISTAVTLCAFVALPSMALAQTNPIFEFQKKEEVKKVEWKAQVKGGLLLNGGNAQATTSSISGNASRKAGKDKLGIDIAAAYGTTNNRTVTSSDALIPGSTIATGTMREDKESTNNASAKGRYDRFLTENNSAYAVALLARDKIAGKKLFGGGQVGYSRQLLKNDTHTVLAEAGYDFSYESYVSNDPSVSVHSARFFAGEVWKVNGETGVYGNAEALFNLNEESKAYKVNTNTQGVGAFEDIRINLKLGLTTTLYKNFSFGFGLTMKYDQNPAPFALPSGIVYHPQAPSRLFNNEFDYIADASLIVTLL